MNINEQINEPFDVKGPRLATCHQHVSIEKWVQSIYRYSYSVLGVYSEFGVYKANNGRHTYYQVGPYVVLLEVCVGWHFGIQQYNIPVLYYLWPCPSYLYRTRYQDCRPYQVHSTSSRVLLLSDSSRYYQVSYIYIYHIYRPIALYRRRKS